MTLSQSFSRVGAFVGALAVTAGVMAIPATPVDASAGRYYTIELAQPAQAKEAIVRGVMFKCEGTSCRAPITGSAPRNVCASVAKEFGEVAMFKAGDRVLDANDMATCNAKKKVYIAKD
ncbi:MAG: CC_3452 family protein [Beijerinckiaceae bacterium]